jgi:hypothetical protein
VLAQLLKVQVVGLPPSQNCLDNVRSKESARENLAHRTFRQPGVSGRRSLIGCLSLKKSFVPAVRSRSGFYQWLHRQGQAVGYYPGSIYRGGQLTRKARLIEYGGETVGSTVWPPMGSGHFASAGWQYAAYQYLLPQHVLREKPLAVANEMTCCMPRLLQPSAMKISALVA